MRSGRVRLILVFLALAACAEQPPGPPPVQAEMVVPGAGTGRLTPKGVRIEPSGYGTIRSAPPSAYEPPPPGPAAGPKLMDRPGAPAIEPDVAHLVRLLPRQRPPEDPDRLVITNLDIPPRTISTLILRDGCFRLAVKDEPLVLFPPGTRVFVDEQGYLSVGLALAPTARGRVGEPVSWEGEPRVVTEPEVTEPIRRFCGAGPVVRIGLTGSVAAQTSDQDAATAASISRMYGYPYSKARRMVADCRADAKRRSDELRARYGDRNPPGENIPGPCQQPPPPPVADPASCPPGSSFAGGLCRTREGHIVRVPPGPVL